MPRFTTREMVKDLLGIARADAYNDANLNLLIQMNSEDVERRCRRSFAKEARTEYFTSYEQAVHDPSPQYLWLNGPVDTGESFSLQYATYGRHDTNARVLTQDTDYLLDAAQGLVTILGNKINPDIQMILSRQLAAYEFDPQGFKVTYTGGYETTTPPDPYNNPDPLDDYGVTQVPDALKMLVAQKVARDFQEKTITEWKVGEISALKQWSKRSVFE